MKIFAKFISIIYQPLFMPLYAILLYPLIEHHSTFYLRSVDTADFYRGVVLPVALLSVLFPLFSVFILYKSRIISSIQAPIRKERLPIFILSILYYSMTYFIMRNIHLNSGINLMEGFLALIFAGIMISVLGLLLTLRWKISMHAMGISAMAGAFIAFGEALYPIKNLDEIILLNVFLLVSIGVVGTSRLVLNAHKAGEVYGGIILGFGVEYLIVSNLYWI